MKKLLFAVSFVALCATASAAPITCTPAALGLNVLALNANPMPGCTGGGLLFDMFSVNSAPPGTTIFVSALGTGPIAFPAGFSLGFQITTPTPPVDTILQYRVSTVDGSLGIVGVDNAQNGVNTTIGEVVCDQAFVAGICATGHVIVNFSNPPVPNNAVQAFAARNQIFILKDISEPSTNSFISSFVNSQETNQVPEPASMALIGVGLLGLGLLRKRN